jgi:glycosyltransferase involved in cell wall biosynthesis
MLATRARRARVSPRLPASIGGPERFSRAAGARGPGERAGRRGWYRVSRRRAQGRLPAMPGREKTIVVMPAYNAANTLERCFADIPREHVDEIIVVDDCSKDDTRAIARRLPVTLIEHEKNLGYGGNQKTCYRAALERGADYVIMIHADYQYDARMIPTAVDTLRLGICDVVLGNRIRTRREALDGGMPLSKYFANRGLTILENLMSGQNLGEWHSGFRGYRRKVLETIPYQRNSDDFVFDSQFLVQSVSFGFKLGDVPVPVRYFDEASSINLRRSTIYALLTMRTFLQWYLHRAGLSKSPLFESAGQELAAPAASKSGSG